MSAEFVKCYRGNYDGLRAGLVVARNQKEAAAVVGSSVHSFRQYWSAGSFPEGWTPKSDVLYTRPFNSNGNYSEGLCEIIQKKGMKL